MAISTTRTVWQFYAAGPKTRRHALARAFEAGNRFFATAKGKRKKFYAEAVDAGAAIMLALMLRNFWHRRRRAAKRFFLNSTNLVD
jgi:mannose/cellobiose epimerase-like protein (N-acyl-D-glucosamine 2-epimerase family)